MKSYEEYLEADSPPLNLMNLKSLQRIQLVFLMKPIYLKSNPHHGVYQKTLTTLLSAVKPSRALITSSAEEPEDPETLSLLEENGVEVFLTRTAPVLIISDGKTLDVRYDTAADDNK